MYMDTNQKVTVMFALLRFSVFLAIFFGSLFISVMTIHFENNRFKETKHRDKLRASLFDLTVDLICTTLFIIVVNGLFFSLSIEITNSQLLDTLLFSILPAFVSVLMLAKVNKKHIAKFRSNMNKYN